MLKHLLHIILFILIAQVIEAKNLKIEVKDKASQNRLLGGTFLIEIGAKKAYKLAKKKLGTHKRAMKKREALTELVNSK